MSGRRKEMPTPPEVVPCRKCGNTPALSSVDLIFGLFYDLTCFKCNYDMSRRTVADLVAQWNAHNQPQAE